MKTNCMFCNKEINNSKINQKTCGSVECVRAYQKAYQKAYRKTDKCKAYKKAYYQRKKEDLK